MEDFLKNRQNSSATILNFVVFLQTMMEWRISIFPHLSLASCRIVCEGAFTYTRRCKEWAICLLSFYLYLFSRYSSSLFFFLAIISSTRTSYMLIRLTCKTYFSIILCVSVSVADCCCRNIYGDDQGRTCCKSVPLAMA